MTMTDISRGTKRPSFKEFISSDPKPHTSPSLVIGAVGPRGGGKTAIITGLNIEDMARGRDSYNVMPIQGYIRKNGKIKWVESNNIDFIQLVTFPSFPKGSILNIDEFNTYFDALSHAKTTNKDFNNWAQQLRKDNVSLLYTAQNFKWIDNRIRFQTDMLISCFDMFYDPASRAMGVQMGEYILWNAYDMSGKLTGKIYDAVNNPDAMSSGLFYARPIWKYYPTDWKKNSLETDIKLVHQKQVVTVGLVPDNEPDEPPAPTPAAVDPDAFKSLFQYKSGKK